MKNLIPGLFTVTIVALVVLRIMGIGPDGASESVSNESVADELPPVAPIASSVDSLAAKALTQVADASAPQRDEEPASAEELPAAIKSEDEFKKLVKDLDLWSPSALAASTQRLRATDATVVATLFEKSLAASANDLAQRDRLLTLADNLGPETMLKFWQKIVTRSPPRSEGELEKGVDRRSHDVFAVQELQSAVRNIRLIATENDEARRYLERMVLEPALASNDDLIRGKAFFALKEIDPPATLRILRLLPDDDTLLTMIIAR